MVCPDHRRGRRRGRSLCPASYATRSRRAARGDRRTAVRFARGRPAGFRDPRLSPHAIWAQPRISERSEEHTSELQSHSDLVCRLLLEKKKKTKKRHSKI